MGLKFYPLIWEWSTKKPGRPSHDKFQMIFYLSQLCNRDIEPQIHPYFLPIILQVLNPFSPFPPRKPHIQAKQ